MIEWTERPGTSWWALIRGNTAACWWRLLAVHTLFSGVGLAEVRLCSVLDGWGPTLVGDILLIAANGLIAAWCWSASLRILDGGHGFRSALLPDPRRIGRLWGWLVVVHFLGLLRLLVHVDAEAYLELLSSPAMQVVALASLYLAFAAALLPMAILLEGRGVRRARQLSHGDWLTVLRVLPVVVLGAILSGVLVNLQVTAMGDFPQQPHLLPAQAAAFVVGVLEGTLTAVLLYVAYRLSGAAALLDPRPGEPVGQSPG